MCNFAIHTLCFVKSLVLGSFSAQLAISNWPNCPIFINFLDLAGFAQPSAGFASGYLFSLFVRAGSLTLVRAPATCLRKHRPKADCFASRSRLALAKLFRHAKSSTNPSGLYWSGETVQRNRRFRCDCEAIATTIRFCGAKPPSEGLVRVKEAILSERSERRIADETRTRPSE